MTAALALLVAVMSSPIRPLRPTTASQSDHFRRNFVMPKGGTTHHRSPAPLHSRVLQVKALHAETEDELGGGCRRGTLPLLSPPALYSGVEHHGNRLVIPRAMHPLRC